MLSLPAIALVVQVDNSNLTAWADQVSDMFPQIARAIIEQDLARTHSIEVTIDNLINGDIPFGDDAVGAGMHLHMHEDELDDEDDDEDMSAGSSEEVSWRSTTARAVKK